LKHFIHFVLILFTNMHLYQQMKVDKKATEGAQLTLDGALEKQSKVKIYIHNGATHAVAQFVMCNDQVYVMAVQHVNAQIGWPSSCSC
jgi:hypothetical protein